MTRDPSVEYARLEHVDLLVLAPAPPEPPARDLVQHLRSRSRVAIVALVIDSTASARAAVVEAGADDCLDVATDDLRLLHRIESVLTDRSYIAGPRAEEALGATG